MSVASYVNHVLRTFQLVISPTQRALPEDGNSLFKAILDQLSYTRLCDETFFLPMPLHAKAASLRKKMTYKLKQYIRSGAMKLNECSDLTIEDWVKQMKR